MKNVNKGWLTTSVILFIIQIIYHQFSHGVSSLFMFLIWVPAFLMTILNFFNIRSSILNMLAWTMIFGLFVKGVLEIAGTNSSLLLIYPILIGTLLIIYAFSNNKKKSSL